MGNSENLTGRGFDELTADEQREIASKGGIASGEARRRKRDIRLALEALLERDYKGKNGAIISGAEAIALKQMERALKGDTRAFEVIRDTAGQKPVDKVETTQTVIDMSKFTTEEIKAMLGDDI